MKSKALLITISLTLITLLGCENAKTGDSKLAHPGRWWPTLKKPAAIVRTTDISTFAAETSPTGRMIPAGPAGTTHIMVQSLAGLAAKAVDQGKLDEMVWITVEKGMYAEWLEALKNRGRLEDRGQYDPFQLLKRYVDKGIVKGYVLYSYDFSEGHMYEKRENIDHSANTATVAASVLDAVMIEEGQQDIAKKLGLKMLFDARGKGPQWCFDNFKDNLDNDLLLTIDPKTGHNRAMAIAHRSMVIYGVEDPIHEVLAWLQPPAPVMGWNCGNEDEHTRPVTLYGHFQTASNWALNLPILSAGAEHYDPIPVPQLDPATIDYDSGTHFTSFLMSDGDNLQWMMGNFVDNDSYWTNKYNGQFGFGWTACPGHLNQVCPEVLEYIAVTKPANVSVVEHGAGYYYPDLFAEKRQNREEILAVHARNISKQMKQHGVNVLSFICQDVLGKEARKAYEIYAREIDPLIGMIALQYYPYDGGDGEVMWFKNSRGVEIPVVTAKFSTWNNARWPRGGTPAKVARLTNEYAQKMQQKGEKSFSVTAAHAWSTFQQAPGSDDMAENIPRDADKSKIKNVHRGLTTIKWLVDRLDPQVKVVSPEELIWRIRYEHDPEATIKAIK